MYAKCPRTSQALAFTTQRCRTERRDTRGMCQFTDVARQLRCQPTPPDFPANTAKGALAQSTSCCTNDTVPPVIMPEPVSLGFFVHAMQASSPSIGRHGWHWSAVRPQVPVGIHQGQARLQQKSTIKFFLHICDELTLGRVNGFCISKSKSDVRVFWLALAVGVRQWHKCPWCTGVHVKGRACVRSCGNAHVGTCMGVCMSTASCGCVHVCGCVSAGMCMAACSCA
jgi:hypothetical protein